MKTLPELRHAIDKIDRQLLHLLNQRATLALEVGQAKSASGITTMYNPERESEVIAHVQNLNHGPLKQNQLEAIFKLIMFNCRSLEEDLV